MNITELQNELTKRNINIQANEICKIWGMDVSSFSRKKKTNSEIKYKNIEQLEKALGISIISGEQLTDDDCVDVAVRGNLTASLGAGIEIIDETQTGTFAVSRKLMRDVGASIDTTDFVPCEGDSMYPTIEGGALLMVDRSKTEIFDGKIYCVRLNNQLMAKRLQFLPPNKVKVISDNKEKYDPFYVDLSKQLDFDFAIVGEVKWYGTVTR